MVAYIAFLLVELITWGNTPLMVIGIVVNIGVGVFLVRYALARQKIKKGLLEIAKGNVNYKIPLDDLRGETLEMCIRDRFVTKGDANEKEDPNPVSYDQLRGQVVYSIPYLGWIAGLLSETTGKLAAAGMIAAAVLLHVAAGIMFRKTES